MLIKQSPNSCLIDQYLFQKPEPNLSIKIEQVEEKTKHTFTCQCEMCMEYAPNKVFQLVNEKEAYLNRKIQQKVKDGKVPSEYFLEILKKLVLPHHKIVKRGIDIYIPEICFFTDGQSKGIFMNRQLDDFSIKKIHKNHINPGVIQRIFNQRRREYRQDIKKKLGISDRRPLSQNKIVMQQKNKKQSSIGGGQQKDLIVVKYTDGFETLMPETEFIMLTLRRKQDPIWRTIEIIKNNITVNDEINNVIFVKYDRLSVKYENLLERSRTLARIYAENIVAGQATYISPEDENEFSLQLLKRNKKSFAEYVVYKIVSFIEYFYDEQITKLSCKILINEINKPYLMEVTSYKKKTLMKFTWTNDTYKRKQDQEEQKLFVNRAIEVTEQLEEKSKMITGMMEEKYAAMKTKYGISLIDEDNEEEVKNNEFWKKIHPEFQGIELSELLVSEKNLTVNGFKRKYLGYKEEKKPIVKDFTTHMINVLHKTAPRIKLSQFHEVPFKPNESGFFSSRRPNTCSFSKRSSFSALTSHTKRSSNLESSVSPQRPVKREIMMNSSRTPSSSSSVYRRPKKSGCHLHASPAEFSITNDFLNFHR